MLLRYAWKSLIRRRTRSSLSILGIALSVALLVAVLAISDSVRGAVQDSLGAAGADMIVQKRVKPCPFAFVKIPKDLAAIPTEVVEQLGAVTGVEHAAGVLELWAFYQGHPTVVTGIDPAARQLGPVRLAQREEDEKCCAVVEGRYLVKPDDYHAMLTTDYSFGVRLFGTDYAAAIEAHVGDKVHLGPVHKFEVVGIVDLGEIARVASAEAFIPIRIAQKMLAQGDVVDTIFVALEHTRHLDPVSTRATALIGEDISITTATQVDAGTAALARVNQLALLGVAAIALAFVLLLVIIVAVNSVTARTDEVGLMKALGWRDAEVSRLFLIETLAAGLLGGIIGSVLGWAVAYVYGRVADLQLPDALSSYPPCATTPPPLSLPLTVQPSLAIFGTAIVLSLLIAGLAGLAAARRAARLEPVQALRRL